MTETKKNNRNSLIPDHGPLDEQGREILLEGRMESNKSEKDGQKRTFWGITVDTFEFCGSKSDGSAPAQPVDSASGMPVVETEELPF